jgi:hypothetical protein
LFQVGGWRFFSPQSVPLIGSWSPVTYGGVVCRLRRPVSNHTGVEGSAMDSAVRQAARWVRQLGESDFADSFGGLRIDLGRNELTVYRRPSDAFDATLRETVTAVPLVLRDAPYCLRDLREVQRRVEQDSHSGGVWVSRSRAWVWRQTRAG